MNLRSCCCVSWIFICCLLFILLLSFSFQYVGRNQVAFKVDRTTSRIDTTHVYGVGRYVWGPGYDVITFPSTFQFVSFTPESQGSLSIFTDNGLSIFIECSFQYRIQLQNLAKLFAKYATTYDSQVVNIARAALKNVAPKFSVDDYVKNRTLIIDSMYFALKDALTAEFVDVPVGKFQLRKVTLPDVVVNKYLQTQLQLQLNTQRTLEQQVQLIRKQTDFLVAQISSNTTVIQQKADAVSARIIQDARNTATYRLQQYTGSTALNTMFTALGITSDALKTKFLTYSSILDGFNTSKLVVGFDSSTPFVQF
jgi:hypothetical protein